MDTITHGLVGAAIGGLLAPRRHLRGVAFFAAVAGALPDADLFFRGLIRHRAETHSFFYIALGAPLIAYLAKKIFWRDADAGKTTELAGAGKSQGAAGGAVIWDSPPTLAIPPAPAPTFSRLWLIAMLALLSHIVLDWSNSYGLTPFLPFSDKLIAFDAMPIVDFLFSVPLLILFVILLSVGAKREKFARRLTVVVSLWCAVYLGAAIWFSHRVTTVAPLAGAGEVRASPLTGSILIWRVAKTNGRVGTVVYVDALRNRVLREEHFIGDDTPRTRAALAAPGLQNLLTRSRGVYVMNDDGAAAWFRDLRYGDLTHPETAMFAARISFDGAGKVASVERQFPRGAFSVGKMWRELKQTAAIAAGGVMQ
jgi:membrane-bound metal-dependent hydrolase YbcI (DUF457 family)